MGSIKRLLISTAIDENNKIILIAFAIVEKENTDTWSWFLTAIRAYVTDRRGLCLISDRHISIKKAVDKDYRWKPPFAFHVYCLRHLVSNFNKKFKDAKLKRIAVAAGMQRQVWKFERDMQKIEEIRPQAAEWLRKLPLSKWTLSHDKGRRYGIMTTNMSECFNSVLKNARFFLNCFSGAHIFLACLLL